MRKRRASTLRFFYFVFDQRYDKIADGLVLRSRQRLQLCFQLRRHADLQQFGFIHVHPDFLVYSVTIPGVP